MVIKMRNLQLGGALFQFFSGICEIVHKFWKCGLKVL